MTSHIQKLLEQHKYVVVPGFGGFVCRNKPAELQANHYIIHPPRIEIHFNPKLSSNDGLLVNALVTGEGFSYQEAERFCTEQIQNWKLDLKKGKRIRIQSLGEIYLDLHGIVKFKQNNVSNLLESSFGLELAKAIPVRREALINQTREITPTPETIIIERLPVKYKRFQSISLSLIVLLTISASYLFFLSFSPEKVDQAGLNFFNIPVLKPDSAIIEPTTEFNADPIAVETTDVHVIESDLQDNIQEVSGEIESTAPSNRDQIIPKTPAEIKPAAEISTIKVDKSYHVIVSSLNSVDRIQDEISRYKKKGYSPIIIPTDDGKYRISIGSFASRDSAETFKQNIFNDNSIDGWVLPK